MQRRLPCGARGLLCLSLFLVGCSDDAPVTPSAPAGAGGSGASGGTTSTGGSAGLGGEGGVPDGEGGAGASALLYANVTAVAVSGTDGAYTFDVSVESADIDCTQFADWWEVLGEDGALLYRRILEHSHTDENGASDANAPGNTFTRNGGPVPVGAQDVVYVRAHLNVGGYNGVVMRGTPSGVFTEALDLAPDFALAVEDDLPQPGECQF